LYPVLVPVRLYGTAKGYHDCDYENGEKKLFHGFPFNFAIISFAPPLPPLVRGQRESENKIEGDSRKIGRYYDD
jgi:hypothetical protein